MLQLPICIAIAASSMAKGEGKGDWGKWMQWDFSHEGCEESSQCREWDAGVVYTRGKMQWYIGHQLETLMRPWWQKEAEEDTLCVPSWRQMVHKARTTIQYIWQLLHGWLFHKWGSFGTGRGPKWEDQARTAKQLFVVFNSLWFYVEWFMVLDLILTTTIFGVPTVLLSPDTGLLMSSWQPWSSRGFFFLTF